MIARRLFPSMTPARWAGIAALVVLVAAFPLVYRNQYVLTVIVTGLVLLVLNISWNFVLGVAGVWNFGQLAIYALGGYGAGILMLHTPLPPWLAVLGGGVIAAVIAILLAFPTLRLYGIYTSLLTFAFAEIVQYVILNDGSGLTGGSYGFPTVPGLYSSLSPDASMRAYYWTVLGVVVVSTAGLAAVGHSHLGIAVRAVRDAPAYTSNTYESSNRTRPSPTYCSVRDRVPANVTALVLHLELKSAELSETLDCGRQEGDDDRSRNSEQLTANPVHDGVGGVSLSLALGIGP